MKQRSLKGYKRINPAGTGWWRWRRRLHIEGCFVVFYCLEEHFLVEALQIYSANVVNFHLASGGQRWHIVGR